MIEIVNTNDHGKIIWMNQMEPLEIGTICACPTNNPKKGHLVMRTAAEDQFEVMDLTDPQANSCWTTKNCLNVLKVFIPKDTVFNLNISNKK